MTGCRPWRRGMGRRCRCRTTCARQLVHRGPAIADSWQVICLVRVQVKELLGCQESAHAAGQQLAQWPRPELASAVCCGRRCVIFRPLIAAAVSHGACATSQAYYSTHVRFHCLATRLCWVVRMPEQVRNRSKSTWSFTTDKPQEASRPLQIVH